MKAKLKATPPKIEELIWRTRSSPQVVCLQMTGTKSRASPPNVWVPGIQLPGLSNSLVNLALFLEWIAREQGLAQPEVGIIQVGMKDLFIEPLGDILGLNRARGGQDLVDLHSADGVIDSSIFGQSLPKGDVGT